MTDGGICLSSTETDGGIGLSSTETDGGTGLSSTETYGGIGLSSTETIKAWNFCLHKKRTCPFYLKWITSSP